MNTPREFVENPGEDSWENFSIDLQPKALNFHDGKIYASVQIQPESARQHIRKFILYVDNFERGEFNGSFQDISVSGFDTTRKPKNIQIKIRAIPVNDECKITKESENREFEIDGRTFGLSPVVHLRLNKKDFNFRILVTWQHIGDGNAHKYLVYLDKKEIYHINQCSISPNIQICIHRVERGEHTLQIVAKLQNGKQTHKSDIICVFVPDIYNNHNLEVLNILNEQIPWNFQGAPPKVEGSTKTILLRKGENPFKNNAKALYEKLQKEIDDKWSDFYR